MGCSGSKSTEVTAKSVATNNAASGKKQRILWLAGCSSAGKTFTGDYLATRGWHHIDGDMGNQSDDPKMI